MDSGGDPPRHPRSRADGVSLARPAASVRSGTPAPAHGHPEGVLREHVRRDVSAERGGRCGTGGQSRAPRSERRRLRRVGFHGSPGRRLVAATPRARRPRPRRRHYQSGYDRLDHRHPRSRRLRLRGARRGERSRRRHRHPGDIPHALRRGAASRTALAGVGPALSEPPRGPRQRHHRLGGRADHSGASVGTASGAASVSTHRSSCISR